MSSSDNGHQDNPGAVSSQPSDTDVTDLLGDEDANAGGQSADDAASSSNDTTTGNDTNDSADDVDKSLTEGQLRTRLGQERKIFINALAESDPQHLAKLIEDDPDIRRIAGRQGHTIESLRGASPDGSAGESIPDAFVDNAADKNLNKAEAEQAWQLTQQLKQTGLSDELAQKTALEQVAAGGSTPSSPPSIPPGGQPSTQSQDFSGKISSTEFTTLDHEARARYRDKYGNKFTDS